MKIFSIQYLLIFLAGIIFFSGCGKLNNSNDYYHGHGFGMGYGSGCYENSRSMQNSLELNESQLKIISKIDSKYRKLYYQNQQNFDKINSLRKSHRDEIKKVLNDKQRKIYEKEYENRWHNWSRDHGRRHMGNYYGHGYGMGHGSGTFQNNDGMKQELNLKKEQIEKITNIDSKYRAKYYEKRNDYDAIELLRREHKKEIKKVLTKSQQKKYEELYNYRWKGWRNRHMRGGHMGGGHMMGF